MTNSDLKPSASSVQKLVNLNIFPTNSRIITTQTHRGRPVRHIGRKDTIGFCASGYAVLHINEQNLLLRPNQLIYSPSGLYRGRTGLSDDLVIHEIEVYGEVESIPVFEFLQLRENNYIVDVSPHYLPHLEACYKKLSVTSPYVEDYIFNVGAIADILGIYFALRMQREENDKTFEDVLTYMDEHISTGVTLNELAAVIHMKPTYFITLFKKKFYTSPVAYFNTLRAKKAIDLLAETDLTLSEVGKSIGIDDRYYFSNFFKSQCGIAPDFFRKSIRSLLSSSKETLNSP